MTMPFYKARQEGHPLQVHDSGAGWGFYRSRRTRRLDKVIVYQHLPALLHLLPVEDPVRLQQIKGIPYYAVERPDGDLGRGRHLREQTK